MPVLAKIDKGVLTRARVCQSSINLRGSVIVASRRDLKGPFPLVGESEENQKSKSREFLNFLATCPLPSFNKNITF